MTVCTNDIGVNIPSPRIIYIGREGFSIQLSAPSGDDDKLMIGHFRASMTFLL